MELSWGFLGSLWVTDTLFLGLSDFSSGCFGFFFLFCIPLLSVRDFVAVVGGTEVEGERLALEVEAVCVESGCGKLFVTVLANSGLFSEV